VIGDRDRDGADQGLLGEGGELRVLGRLGAQQLGEAVEELKVAAGTEGAIAECLAGEDADRVGIGEGEIEDGVDRDGDAGRPVCIPGASGEDRPFESRRGGFKGGLEAALGRLGDWISFIYWAGGGLSANPSPSPRRCSEAVGRQGGTRRASPGLAGSRRMGHGR
jgi:hypothetical protein